MTQKSISVLQMDIVGLINKHDAEVQDIFRAMYELINYPKEFFRKKEPEVVPAVCEWKQGMEKKPVVIDDNEACAS